MGDFSCWHGFLQQKKRTLILKPLNRNIHIYTQTHTQTSIQLISCKSFTTYLHLTNIKYPFLPSSLSYTRPATTEIHPIYTLFLANETSPYGIAELSKKMMIR